LIDNGVTISMDGRGRALDNIFVERYSGPRNPDNSLSYALSKNEK
jgi:hypothetical protein